MINLVSLADAKDHLRVLNTAHDAEIASKLAQASAIIRDYLKHVDDATWDETTTPHPVQAATLKLLAELYEHRGDDLAPDNFHAAVWSAVELLLARFKTPALA